MTVLTSTDIELAKGLVESKASLDKELIKFERKLEERLSILRSFAILTGSEGLTQEAAAKAQSKSKSTILRWRKYPKSRSTRPHTVRSMKNQERYDLLKEEVCIVPRHITMRVKVVAKRGQSSIRKLYRENLQPPFVPQLAAAK